MHKDHWEALFTVVFRMFAILALLGISYQLGNIAKQQSHHAYFVSDTHQEIIKVCKGD